MASSMTLPNLYDNFLSTLPPQLHPFFQLSYAVNQSTPFSFGSSFLPSSSSSSLVAPETLYDKGIMDLCITISCAFGFTILRNLSMEYIFSAFARYWLMPSRELNKLEKKAIQHSVTRFAEQSWSLTYCTVFWSLGMVILMQLKAPLSPESLWGSYPVRYLPGLTKFYYLAQLGWWLHQIYVINSEQRRSDHWQMLTHHVLSISLICGSYVANFSRVGVLIHALMDFCDILLPLAKLFRYLSFSTLCDVTFVAFLIGWLVSRQIGLAFVIYTSYVDAPKFIKFRWSPQTGQYLTQTTYYGFIGMEVFLYGLASIWFYMACMVAVRVVTGQGAADSRSDAGDEDEEERNGAFPDEKSPEGQQGLDVELVEATEHDAIMMAESKGPSEVPEKLRRRR
ncbi:putative longevity-assurance protein-like protein [Kockovaella imperatae]|uniref:Putative longevity-assurance protein-like protein n=1 Tax=Kockovaella imperatae TaxID=4999 RepID=A0A1Y1UQH6_9TREE|nr:putative longevity-assurance protein-like protein [Kockovaella imperatae]ORX39706.1 putative longevity-assurance protein-like protein [Kockovaella imperatae]